MMNRMAIFVFSVIIAIHSYGLSPVAVDDFFKNISQSPNIEPGVWSGRGDLCMQKAKETGYLMLWFIYGTTDRDPKVLSTSVARFLENDLCRQTFCDLINNYKYLILCCELYDNTAVRDRKNAIYGYPEPKQILNEATGEYEQNHNGYPVYSGLSESGKQIWCDYPPSLHLLKIDSSVNVIFHLAAKRSTMIYEEKFSPYASRFPVITGMCTEKASKDRFAPWLKQYLDMYPIKEQITEYENAGGATQSYVPSTTVESKMGTNYIYKVVEIAVTETIHPTVYQIAQHRDNLLFRAVTTVGDVLVKRRIDDVLSQFDERCVARNYDGKWFVNHDDTMSAFASELTSISSIDIIPTVDCTIVANQRFGNGFTFEGYDQTTTTNITQETGMSEIGIPVTITVTNVEVTVSSTPFTKRYVDRNVLLSEEASHGKLYRITNEGSATFDILSTK